MVNFTCKCFEIITYPICPGPSLDISRKECLIQLNKKYLAGSDKTITTTKKLSIDDVIDDTTSLGIFKHKWDRLLDAVCKCAKSQKKSSIERWVARALLYNGCALTLRNWYLEISYIRKMYVSVKWKMVRLDELDDNKIKSCKFYDK